MSEALESRSWYRLHLLTWVLILLVGGSLVVENVVISLHYPDYPDDELEIKSVHEPPNDFHWEPALPQFGWPFVYAEPKGTLSEIDRYVYYLTALQYRLLWELSDTLAYSMPFIFINLSIALIILATTAFTTETYLRRKAKWHQYSIQFILACTAFIALFLTNAMYDLVRLRGDWPWDNLLFILIAVGLWCLFWTVWRLVAMGVGRIGGGQEDG